MERSKSIFGNELSTKDYKKALRTQKKSLRKFGDDRNRTYHLKEAPTPAIGQALGVRSLLPSAALHLLLWCAVAVLALDGLWHPHGLWALPHFNGNGVSRALYGLRALLDGSMLL